MPKKYESGKCPYCGSENIRWHETDFIDGGTSQEVECQDCERSWTEYAELIVCGYTLEDGEYKPIEEE